MDVLLANPRGFCAGVDRAIEIVKRAIENFGAPIYVRHEVVHNRFVVDDLKQRGAVFVEELDEVPDGATVIFSAHGVSQAVRSEADRRGLKVFDATCPLVTKVHMEVSRHCRGGRDVVLIGHAGHPEVEGTMGQWRRDAGGWQIWFFTVLAIAISGLLVFWLSRTARGDWKQAVPYALVIGGALGNVIDRLIHGHVIDFIQWHWRGHYWPAFNLADSAIVAGAVGIALFGVFDGRRRSGQGKAG